jgi:sulfonate transport system substrate-binding protein
MPESPFTLPARAFAVAAVAALTAMGLAACGSASDSGDVAPKDAAKVAGTSADASLPSGVSLTFADQNESFRQPWDLSGVEKGAPYKVKWATFSGGPPVLEAIKSGAADIGTVGENVLPIALANDPDRDWVIVGAFANDGGDTYLAVHQGSGINKVADLKGKKIAYPQGTGRQVFVARALQAAGLSLNDIQKIEVPGTEVGPVFASGKVDAAALLGAQKFKSDNPVILTNSRGYGGALSVLVTRRSVLADPKKAAAIGDFVKRSAAAANWVGSHPDALVQALYVKVQGLTAEQGRELLDDAGPTIWRPIDDSVIAYEKDTGALLTKIGITKATDGQQNLFDDRYNAEVTAQNKLDGVTVKALPGQG